MPMILLVVGGSINQSNSVGLTWVYTGLYGYLWGSMRGHFLRGGGENNKDFMLIMLFNANDLIGCGG